MLTLLYRGSLSGCNYACGYCPFAKRRDTRATLMRDAAEVARFVDWAAEQKRTVRVLFTPWGEAMVRRHYQRSMLRLAALDHVSQVSIQTNLSGSLAWLEDAPNEKISLWCTYHPDQVTLDRFTQRCARLQTLGVRFSVGVVAMREHYAAIQSLKAALPDNCPVWLNAYDRRGPGYYTPTDLAWLDDIDRWFQHNRSPDPSRGKPCRAGHDMLSIDGQGDVQRCHFVPTRLGNIYTDTLEAMLLERPCPRFKCECFIGYSHRNDLPFYADFGEGLLARIPTEEALRRERFARPTST
ncbi:MAG: radical SAM/SPASM domain-containing protein [Rhizobacter sp.]